MIKVFTIELPYHAVGRSYRLDFPISGNERYVTGAFAVASVNVDHQPQSSSGTYSNVSVPSVLGKVSLSSDGRVVAPTIPLLTNEIGYLTPESRTITSTAKKLMRAVDFGKLGNKLSIIVEEFPDTYIKESLTEESPEFNLTYKVKVYLKTIKKIC